MLFPYVVGGELFSYLRRAGRWVATLQGLIIGDVVGRAKYQGAEDHLISLGAPEVGRVVRGGKQILKS